MAPPPRPSAIKLIRRSPSRSPSPPRQAPPLSTQAILFNFDDFFPSPSQQARELEEEIAEEATPYRAKPPLQTHQKGPDLPEPSLPEPRADSPPPPPRRFFTSSGSHELMSLALQRSRRTAELEKIQQRDRLRTETGMAVRQEAEAVARRAQPERLSPTSVTIAHTAQNKPPPLSSKAPERFDQRRNAMSEANRASQLPLATSNTATRSPYQLENPPGRTMARTSTNPAPKGNPIPMVSNNGNRGRILQHPPTANTNPVPEPPKNTTSPSFLDRKPATGENKENTEPKADNPPEPVVEAPAPSASQETDYGGGDWIDEIALELMI